jgi:hypothetical protein
MKSERTMAQLEKEKIEIERDIKLTIAKDRWQHADHENHRHWSAQRRSLVFLHTQ